MRRIAVSPFADVAKCTEQPEAVCVFAPKSTGNGFIPYGSPEEVVAAVKEALGVFGRFNGGVLLHGEIGPCFVDWGTATNPRKQETL